MHYLRDRLSQTFWVLPCIVNRGRVQTRRFWQPLESSGLWRLSAFQRHHDTMQPENLLKSDKFPWGTSSLLMAKSWEAELPDAATQSRDFCNSSVWLLNHPDLLGLTVLPYLSLIMITICPMLRYVVSILMLVLLIIFIMVGSAPRCSLYQFEKSFQNDKGCLNRW